MLRSILTWLGFVQPSSLPSGAHGHSHADEKGHGHTHGTIDPSITTTDRGIWAIKWSFLILAVTSTLQLAAVFATGSVALLADTIHNIGDAATAVPLWIAFRLARRKPSPRFTYGYGRVEDLAGVAIVFIILVSAVVAGYEAFDRLLNPKPIEYLGWVAVAGVVGFIGNEWVAIFRIRVGHEINSAALIADGYHARTDGFTSLAVVLGAVGVWLGYPKADPIVGLVITVAIFGIVWQSAKAVFTRLLDGVEPEVIRELRHAAEHVAGVRQVLDARARWQGHRLAAELDIAVDPHASVREADAITTQFEREILTHVPAISLARIRARPHDPLVHGTQEKHPDDHGAHGHHAPEPVELAGELATGKVEIIDTPQGERMTFTASCAAPSLQASIEIDRDSGRVEALQLVSSDNPTRWMSTKAPEEPHEFAARLRLRSGERAEALPFTMTEPEDHHGH
jgi:cation diffusion facilitator family transporter